MKRRTYCQAKAKQHKKRAARFADYRPPATQPVASFHRQPSLIHRGRLTAAALRALFAVTNEQL